MVIKLFLIFELNKVIAAVSSLQVPIVWLMGLVLMHPLLRQHQQLDKVQLARSTYLQFCLGFQPEGQKKRCEISITLFIFFL